MSDYKKKANFKDSIISGVVVLLILIAGVVLIVNQFSEVDLSKKELEELRAEMKIAEVELLEKQDKWDLKVIRDSKSIVEQEEELNAAWENFEREKSKLKQEIVNLKAKYNAKPKGKSESQIRREVRAELNAKNSKSGSKEQTEQILALEAKNESLEKEMADYRKWKNTTQKVQKKAASAEQKKKANAEVLGLMNEFAAYDVDLKKPNWCDREYSARFYKAESKLDVIKKKIKDNGLESNYKTYLENTSRNKSNESPDGWCNGVKM